MFEPLFHLANVGRLSCRILAVAILLLPFCIPSLDASEVADHNTWNVGLQALAERDHVAASQAFQTVLRTNGPMAEAYFNLGLAKKAEGATSDAVVAFLRANALKPGLTDARQALQQLAVEQNLSIPAPGYADRFVARWGSAWLWIFGSLAGWFGAGLLLVGIFRSTKKTGVVALGIVCLLLSGASFGIVVTGDPLVADRNLAVVQGREAIFLRSTPVDNAGPIARITPGSVVTVLSERGRWTYCSLPEGKEGWLPNENIISVLPQGDS